MYMGILDGGEYYGKKLGSILWVELLFELGYLGKGLLRWWYFSFFWREIAGG